MILARVATARHRSVRACDALYELLCASCLHVLPSSVVGIFSSHDPTRIVCECSAGDSVGEIDMLFGAHTHRVYTCRVMSPRATLYNITHAAFQQVQRERPHTAMAFVKVSMDVHMHVVWDA